MKVFDFATNRRAYLMSRVMGNDYSFFLYSDRKSFLTPSERDSRDIERFSNLKMSDPSQCLDSDIVMVTSASMWFKEFQKEAMDLINKSRGKLVCIDYAWDVARTKYTKKIKQLSKDFSAIAVVMNEVGSDIRPLKWSQPEIDMYAIAPEFLTADDVRMRYQVPSGMKVALITSQLHLKKADALLDILKQQDDFYYFWKVKEKQASQTIEINEIIKKHNMEDRCRVIVRQPDRGDYPGKSHTDFFSPVCELSTIIDFHISLPPLCFSHAEMIRAGVPTYWLDSDQPTPPPYVWELANTIWDDQSCRQWKQQFLTNRSKVNRVVSEIWFTENLVRELRCLTKEKN